MDTRRNMPLEFELAEKKGRRDFLLEKAGKVRKTVVDTAKKGLKGGVVGASAAATKGVITGATTVAIGKNCGDGNWRRYRWDWRWGCRFERGAFNRWLFGGLRRRNCR